MKLLFFGTQDWAADFLTLLIKDGFFEIVGVVTQPDKPAGRKQILVPSPVKRTAQAHTLPLFQPTKLSNSVFMETIQAANADIAVVIAYGRIIPQHIIDAVPQGFVNVHPSLLPRWRGPSPVHAAIAEGDTLSGITIMRIDAQMDHGPILAQLPLEVSVSETQATFMDKVKIEGGPFFLQTLTAYSRGEIVPEPQDHDKATYSKMLAKKDGRIDWRLPSDAIERMVRAYRPWPGTWSEFFTEGHSFRIKILEVESTSVPSPHQPGTLFRKNDALYVATGTHALRIISIQPEGRQPMSEQAFLSGYSGLLGQAFVSVAPSVSE